MNYINIIEEQMRMIEEEVKKTFAKPETEKEWEEYQKEHKSVPVGNYPHERDSSWSSW